MQSLTTHIDALRKCIFVGSVAVLGILSIGSSVAEPTLISLISPPPIQIQTPRVTTISCSSVQVTTCRRDARARCLHTVPDKQVSECLEQAHRRCTSTCR